MQDEFAVALDLSWAEYFRLSLYSLLRTKIFRVLIVFVSCIALLTGLLGFLAPGKNEPDIFRAIVQVIGAPLILFLFFFICILLGSLFIVKFKPKFIRGISYRFTHWGMDRTGVNSEINIPWRNFRRLKETRSFFLIYVRENKIDTIHAIQKRKFVDSDQAEEFKRFVESNMPL
jgi:hypothetical protein